MNNKSRRIFLINSLVMPLGACSIQALKPVPTIPSLRPTTLISYIPKVGSTWQYVKLNQYNSETVEIIDEKIISIENNRYEISRESQKSNYLNNEVQQPWGMVKADLDWDYYQTYQQEIPVYIDLNQTNISRYIQTVYKLGDSSFPLAMSVGIRQFGWELVTTRAGVFNTIRIEKIIRFQHNDSTRVDSVRIDRYWYAPEVGRWVIREMDGRYFYLSGRQRIDVREDFWRFELVSWT